jgi:hypothetical protein
VGRRPQDDWVELEPRVLPRLLSERFVRGLPARHDLLTWQLAPAVVIAFIVRSSARGRYVRRRELGGREAHEALAAALQNLATRSRDARLWHVQTDDGPLVAAHSGDGLDSSRLLLPGLHDLLAGELGSPFLAGVPHRDVLYAAPAEGAPARALAARTRAAAVRARHPISDGLFEVHPGGRLRPAHG